MINYTVDKVNDKFEVAEVSSGLVLAVTNDHDSARSLSKGLNLGKAFDGKTPKFFTNGGPAEIITKI